MNEQRIDRERLAEWRDQTARIVEKYGNEAWAEIHANEVVAIIDELTQAEARIEAVRDVLDATEDRGPIGLAFDGTPFPAFVSSADIRRALDGEQ